MSAAKFDRRRFIWPIAKWIVFVVLAYFVGMRAVSLWQSSPPTQIHVDVRWLIPAAGLYLFGWFPSVWFWRSLLRQMGQNPPWYASVRAYFVGHLGKYVPGKALVLVIRAALIKQAGCNPVLAALTAVYETLVFMAAGAAWGLALSPLVIPDGIWERIPASLQFLRCETVLVPLIVAIATIASTPFSAALFTRIGRKGLPRSSGKDLAKQAESIGSVTITTQRITAKHVLEGVATTSVGWVFNALSLGCTLQAISNEPFELTHFPIWLASITLSTFAGFVILVAPGGLGVREWVLVEMLKDQPGMSGETAVIAAGILRAVWFCTELVTDATMYVIRPKTDVPPQGD